MNSLWKKYWQTRETNFKTFLGKKHATISLENIISSGFGNKSLDEIRILDLGCGNGFTLNHIFELFNGQLKSKNLYGLDKNADVLSEAKLKSRQFNYINRDLLENWETDLPQFDLVFSINTFHELFSSSLIENEWNESKNTIENTIEKVSKTIINNGYLLLFDGVEGNDLHKDIKFKLNTVFARQAFEKFCNEYKIFDLSIKNCRENDSYSLSNRDFIRFITKLKWIFSELWEIEKNESYQYFTDVEFENTMRKFGLVIFQKEFFISDLDFWESNITIINVKNNFPWEHILITSKKYSNGQ